MKRLLALAALALGLLAGSAAEARAQCNGSVGAGAGVGISFYCWGKGGCNQCQPPACPPMCCPPMCGAPMPGWGGCGPGVDSGRIADAAAASASRGAWAAIGY